MRIRTLSYFIREASINVERNRSMSLASIGTLTISLTVLGLLCLVLLNLSHVIGSVQSKVEMRVFLRDTVTQAEATVLDDRISKVDGVTKVRYISKVDALKRLRSQLGNNVDLVDIVGDNPLPNSFQVRVRRTSEMKDIGTVVSTYPGVEDVSFGEEFVDKLTTVSRIVWAFTLASAAAMGAAVLFIITNTIRITLFNRRREIEIMKLVGATDSFIQWPFVFEGATLGLLGGLLATVICVGTYRFAAARLFAAASFVPFVRPSDVLVQLSATLLGIGVVVGAVGSLVSIRRFLHV